MSTAVPIEFKCPGCGRTLKAPADKAGLSFPCPACKGPVTVPGLHDPVITAPVPIVPQEVLDAVQAIRSDVHKILRIATWWSIISLLGAVLIGLLIMASP